MPIDICELEGVGVVLRFCPLENSFPQQSSSEDVQTFVQCLEQQLVILEATIQHKEVFVRLVKTSPVLRLVELPEWAGKSPTLITVLLWILLSFLFLLNKKQKL